MMDCGHYFYIRFYNFHVVYYQYYFCTSGDNDDNFNKMILRKSNKPDLNSYQVNMGKFYTVCKPLLLTFYQIHFSIPSSQSCFKN